MKTLFGIILGISLMQSGGADGATQTPPAQLVAAIHTEVLLEGFNGEFCWFHPRAASIPPSGEAGKPAVLLTMQKWLVSASDYFSGLSTLYSPDLGGDWQGPREQPALGWREEAGGITVGVCDVTPGWHGPTGTVLGIGHTVRYKGGHLMGDPRPRETAYAVYDPETRGWTPWRVVEMPDNEKFFSAGCGCGQWLVKNDGTLLVPFYFKRAGSKTYASAVMHCAFDGETLRYLEHGSEMAIGQPRGLYEPSITTFGGRYFMTLRNDVKAYVASGGDGLHFDTPKPWTFEDGQLLGSHNTQQHWVTHSNGLFLAYTRKDANNDHVPRHRAPLFLARVDPERLVVLRDTERVLIPNRGAMLGNFGVCTVNEDETWVTVGEGMYKPEVTKYGADGRVYAARVRWSRPNALARHLP